MSNLLKHFNSKDESGFTLVELIIVVSIVSILGAIALANLREYRLRALNTTSKADLKNGLTAQEAIYADASTYVACPDILQCETLLPGFLGSRQANGNTSSSPYEFTVPSDDHLIGTSKHRLGNITFGFDSASVDGMTES